MRIAIIGAGAMGGLYGAFLARAGCDVHFLMRRDYEAVKSSGLTVKMKPYYTSMHLDRLHQEPMELESVIGEPLRRGQQNGLQLPEMKIIYTG